MSADSDDLHEAFRAHLLEMTSDPASEIEMTPTERAHIALALTLPRAAQELCSDAEREAVVAAVSRAAEAAVTADRRARAN